MWKKIEFCGVIRLKEMQEQNIYCNGTMPGKERYSMRLNGKRIAEVMEEKSLTEKTICSRTGLYQKFFQWIVKEGFASEDAAERPEECEIVAENQDGSLCANIPVAWIKINPTKQLSEEQRREIAERFKRK